MSFNTINGGNPGQNDQHAKLPPQISRYDSLSDSAESDDPLARDAQSKSYKQDTVKRHTGSLAPSSQSSLGAGLKRLPADINGYREVSLEEDDFDAPVMSDLAPRPRGRPPKTLSRPVDASTTSVPSEPRTNTSSAATLKTPARKRGRPKGSLNKLKNVSTAAAGRQARQVKPRPHPDGFVGFPKRRGRPPKLPSPPPRDLYYKTDAPFFPFLCEWMDCKAELHNLETLRRHVYIVHGDSIECMWGKCGRLEEPPEFEEDEAFREHMEEAHLVPLSWHVGDGPNNLGEQSLQKKNDDDIPDYLKDEHGNQVTPSIRDQEEEDLLTWRKNRRKLKELLIRMNDNLPDEAGEEGATERQNA